MHVGVHGHLARQVAPVDLVGAGRFAHAGHLVQAHDAAAAVGAGQRKRQALQVLWRVARLGGQAHVDVVGLVVGRAPVAHGLAGDQGAQAVGHLRDRQAQVGRRVAAHIDGNHRLVGLDARIEVHQARNGADFFIHCARQPCQLLQVGALQ